MDISLFDFELPRDRIALRPVSPRDQARLLRVDGGGGLDDRHVSDLPDLLRPGDLLVSNDTRVIPARLFGHRGEAKIEITLHKRLDAARWVAFARPAKKCRPGDLLEFDGLSAQVEQRDGAEVTVRFLADDVETALQQHGVMPLPPYIAAQRPADARDLDDYQTIFSEKKGAVAAPTAGLHFTDRLLAGLKARGVGQTTLTLHVGAGTFLPVKVDNTEDHRMHAEWGEITPEVARQLNEVRDRGGRIVAVGTTSLRLLESAADEQGRIQPFRGDTDIFITPGYKFRAVDVLMTNFHLPRSTLFMLVSAFCGLDRMQAAYAHAIANDYRFYSYGDACLLFPPSLTEAP
ncbi:S-adenosylmethionine:tRNA ribosyltransferase-isomerase [Iodidimonas muriae]|uniref:S-adenosylmethionine:tRNA ribosyltransferase-isomerase n=1 Tax=Iodidimonas muriae TaxID=261467 RepID=A0ABQ2L7M5_9PROT|nr:tRNA preQ1(34) S-adenosylmethionine ribosyltransferase-isomerase QueA [Iodidimonas muriae]GER06660.1 S-adenosylmethionine:tRNA ribosyltransferase-isomerase [Kordiimonadales bacterium JCM 17843]GGO05701.1 S-adenosylmethionine:tRNA ribosyltransferase-isomerase [Iodidimonas muriae]